MIRVAAYAVVVWGLAAVAHGAEPMAMDMGGYTALQMHEVGVMDISFDAAIERLSDGVKITLTSDDPALKPLPISCQEMAFAYAEGGDGKPQRITLQGRVTIDHPEASVRADKADWDLVEGTLTFTGSPVITNASYPKGIEGEKVILNFTTRKFRIYGGRAESLPLSNKMASGGESGPEGLSEKDITDWPKFLETIRTEAAASDPSPGKQVVTLLEPKVQKLVTTVPVETLLEDKPSIVKQLNKVLANPKLYTEAAWAGVTLDDAVKAQLTERGTGPATGLNRALLHAAYPGLVAAPKAAQ